MSHENLHAMALPLKEQHSGEVMFETVRKLLVQAFSECYHCQLISVNIDGDRNMTGKYQGVVTYWKIYDLPDSTAYGSRHINWN